MRARSEETADRQCQHAGAAQDAERRSMEALFARGQAYRQAKDFVMAQRDYQAAFDHSGDGQLLYYVGFCELKNGHLPAARGNFERAMANDFSCPQVAHNIAYCSFKVNDRKQAAEQLEGSGP